MINVPIFLRAHTEAVKKQQKQVQAPSASGTAAPPKWPKYVLLIDCETTTDALQALMFGFYRYCRRQENGSYICIEEGMFYADDLLELDPAAAVILKEFVKGNRAETPQGYPVQLRLLRRSDFVEQVFWKTALGPPHGAGAMVVGFNLPFDLTRLAADVCASRRRNEGWSLTISQDRDPSDGQLRDNPFRPRIKIKPKDSKAAFIRFAGVSIRNKRTGKRLKAYWRGHFLDLRTLGWALRNQSYSLENACQVFNVPGKLNHKPTGTVSLEEIEYYRQDVRASVDLLNAMKTEFDLHKIDLSPERAFSPASIAKAYLKQMGIIPPSQKFALSPMVQGKAMQAYYGGRAECRIRHTPVPVVYTDFLSEYPTVNALMGFSRFLTAERLRIEDATEKVRQLLANILPDIVLDQDFWKQLPFFALVKPTGSILPVRTTYDGETDNIGVNPLTSERPIWYAGPDLVAAALLGGPLPKIIEAFRVVPEGQQEGLKPVALRSMVEIDPRTGDFFRSVIEARSRIKSDMTMAESDRKDLGYFLKILANAGSYGLFVELNPDRVGDASRAKVQVFSGEEAFPTTTLVLEEPGKWYCPLFAALITAAGRLLLALLERLVRDAGGTYLLCDTDSMAIVASSEGGLVPCASGGDHLPDGREAIKALSWPEVQNIVAQLERLNPYNRTVVPGSILKVEDVNFAPDGTQRQLYGYAIAAKRYDLFTQAADGNIHVEKASGHGLGFLYPPRPGFDSKSDAPTWVVEAWNWILQQALGIPCEEPSWFELPAMMRFTITTAEVLKVLQQRQRDLPYKDRTKPHNFILSPVINPIAGYPVGVDPAHFTLIAPFTSDPSKWFGLSYVNIHDGKLHKLGRPGARLPYEAEPKTYRDVVSQYRWHPEAKSLAPDGTPCTPRTCGLLLRTPVTAEQFQCIGKETDRRWEQGEDLSLLNFRLQMYSPNETERLIADPVLRQKLCAYSIRAVAKAANVSDRTVKDARRGDRIQKSTANKLRVALMTLSSAE